MSPEQAAGERTLDARSDVYSLGCVLYEMLAGEPPYTGPTAQAVIAKRFTDPVPRVRRLRPTVPAAVEQALMRALAEVPADRFATAAAFAEALTRARPPARPAAAVRRRAPVPQPERRPGERVLRRRHHRGRDRPALQDSRAQGDLARLGHAVQEAGAEPARDRRDARRRHAARRQRPARREPGAHRRAADRRRDRPAPLGRDVRPRADRHLRHPERRRAADRRARSRPSCRARSDAGSARSRPTTSRRTSSTSRDGTACPAGPRRGWTRASSISSTRSPAIRISRWHTPAWPTPTPASGSAWQGRSRPTRRFGAPRRRWPGRWRSTAGWPRRMPRWAISSMRREYDWAGAEAEFKRAIELNPNSGDASTTTTGCMLSALERYDEAIAMQQRAHELDPLAHRMDMATTLLRAGRYDEALRRRQPGRRRRSALRPGARHPRMGLPAAGADGRGDRRAAAGASRCRPRAPCTWPSSARPTPGREGPTRRATCCDDSRRCRRQRYVSPYHIAYVYTGLGEYDRAMDWLERAYEERAGAMFGIKGSFLFTPLRSHPRFRALLRKMNLDQESGVGSK